MDGSRDYHTKWSKLDRERQRWYGIIYVWNLKGKKTHKWTYFQNRNWLTDTENKLMFTKWQRGGWGTARINIHKLLCIKQMTSEDLLDSTGNYTQYYATTSKGKEPESKTRAGGEGAQRMGWPDGITDSTDRSLSKLQEEWRTGKPGMLGVTKSQTRHSDWTLITCISELLCYVPEIYTYCKSTV